MAIKKLFMYLFGSILNKILDEFRADVRKELAKEVDTLRIEAAEKSLVLRRDMALEMNRVGLAMMATNHQVMLLKGDMTVVKTTHNQILEVARKLTEMAPIPEKRAPGQVDWQPDPRHFGNKIEFTT
jgi:hypothetical protein